jgi:hypothetical protein
LLIGVAVGHLKLGTHQRECARSSGHPDVDDMDAVAPFERLDAPLGVEGAAGDLVCPRRLDGSVEREPVPWVIELT